MSGGVRWLARDTLLLEDIGRANLGIIWDPQGLLALRFHWRHPPSCSFPSMLCLLLQPGSSLEQTHIFVLAHILRRPIIVYGVKYYKSFRGETLGYTRFQGEHFVNSLVPVFHQSVEYCTVPRERGRTQLPLWKIAPAYMRLHGWHSRHNCPSDVSVMSVYSIHHFGVSHSVLVLCGSKQYEKNTPASQRSRFRSMLRWWDHTHTHPHAHTHTWVYLNTCKLLEPIPAAGAQPAFAVSGKTGPHSCWLMPHRGWWKCSVMADRSWLSLRDGSVIYGCQE